MQRITWPQGTKNTLTNPDADMSGHFTAPRVRPAAAAIARDENSLLPEVWLMIE
jgi:hypothetical protein